MADRLTISVDVRALLAALDQLGPAAERHVHRAARITAEQIRDEASGRVRRATGKTAGAITIEEAPPPLGGYRVFVGAVLGRAANLPQWIEFGTRRMEARPFLFSSARLEEGAHLRRISEAMTKAIAETGLGG